MRYPLSCAAAVMLTAWLAPMATHAQGTDVQINIRFSRDHTRCMDGSGGVTPAMIACTSQENARWDQRLNNAYRGILASRELSERAKTQLRDAQRAWIAYREKACIAAGDLTAEGGTLSRVVANECFLRMTALRAAELETLGSQGR